MITYNKPLRYLFSGTFISSVGDWCRHVAIVGLVISCTGAGLKMAVILLLEVIPLLIVGPMAGVVIDKTSPRKVMIVCDVARALFSLGFLFIRSQEQLWMAYSLTALISLFDAPVQASRQTLISRFASNDNLVTAHSLFSIGTGFCIAVGAVAATGIAGTWGNRHVFIFDAATYLFSCYFLLRIREGGNPLQPCGDTGKIPANYFQDLQDGLRYVRSNHKARLLLIFNMLRSIGSGIIYFLLGVFGYTVFNAGFEGVGLFHVTFGVGFLLGAIVANKLAIRFGWMHYGRIMGIAAVTEGILVIVFSRMDHFMVALAVLSLAYTGRSVVITIFNSLSSRLIEDQLRGRYFALNRVLSYTAMGITMLLCGWVLDLVSARQLAFFAGVFLFVNGLLWIGRRPKIFGALTKVPEFTK